jgi:hypothetical protein
MANNRMLLIHRATGRAYILAKWYPRQGWCPRVDDDSEEFSDFLDEHQTIDWEGGADFDLAYENEEGLRYSSNRPLKVTRKLKIDDCRGV